MGTRMRLDHVGLGFGHVADVRTCHALALVMHFQHDSSCLGFRFREELHQNQDHELHRGIVVIVKNDAVATRMARQMFALDFNVNVRATARVLVGLDHDGFNGKFAIVRTAVEGSSHPLPAGVTERPRPPIWPRGLRYVQTWPTQTQLKSWSSQGSLAFELGRFPWLDCIPTERFSWRDGGDLYGVLLSLEGFPCAEASAR
jgi:hypothetical protein